MFQPLWQCSTEDARQLAADPARLIVQLARCLDRPLAEAVGAAALRAADRLRHGQLARWQQALVTLPELQVQRVELDADTIRIVVDPVSGSDLQALEQRLRALIPWRKGPFEIAGLTIDTEWRSDWKWQRAVPHIQPLGGRLVLDVGCGNGYHLWRMRAAGARGVLGVDPGLLFHHQFQALQRSIADPAVQHLPLPLEALDTVAGGFDTVFSMGVLHHRREPLAHLQRLCDQLRPGGELVLETLVAPDLDDAVLSIEGRYARMRNLWQLPGLPRLERWMAEAGLRQVRTVSIDQTSVREQRRTSWMPFDSLAEALDPHDTSLTIEGYPRPCRALVLATLP